MAEESCAREIVMDGESFAGAKELALATIKRTRNGALEPVLVALDRCALGALRELT